MRNKCFDEVGGFEELASSNDIRICFLHDPEAGYDGKYPKRPEGRPSHVIEKMCEDFLSSNDVHSFEELGILQKDFINSINGRYNYRSVEEANLPANRYRNLGFTLPQEHERNVPFWVAIDVDGQDYGYMTKNDPELKKATRFYLFECIKYGLNKRGIKFVCNTTANNGFHFYFKTKESYSKDHAAKVLTYPSSQELIDKVNPEILQKYPNTISILDQSIGTKAIEIFTKAKMVVAPGSVINGKKYELLPDGVQDFREVSVYEDGPVEDLILEILTEDCSFFQKTIEKKSKNDFRFQISDEKKELSQTNIKNLGDFIIYAFQHISGQKHYATLALGGFLYNQNISENSIVDLGEYIIDNAPENLFKGSKEDERESGFLQVLVHDSLEDSDKERTGLTTLKEMFTDTPVPLRELTKILWTNANPHSHTFAPNGNNSATYKEVTVDFRNKETRMSNLKNVINDEGERMPPVRLSNHIIRHVLTDINYVDNISAEQISDVKDMPVSFYIESKLRPDKLYISKNTEEMINQYHSLPLAHQRGSNDILALVIDEYESIGLMGMIERSIIPGIYLSRDGKKLRRYVYRKGEVVEEPPELPDKTKLQNALKLLKQINDVYPWYGDKFATFVKLGMLLPYGYVFKSVYGSFIHGIILYGEAGTCKSSASELLIRMNIPKESLSENELEYIVPGSEFSTPYRMGKALSAHSYPVMIEEVENVFNDAENRDLIKNSITRKFIRNPGGEEKYYSRAIPIFSANELNDEIEKSGMFRRFLILNFVNGERGDKDEVEEALSFLNKNGVRNSRFGELYIISEFIFHTLEKHLEYFGYKPQKIIDKVLEDMEKYTQMDLSWLIEPNFEDYYQSDRADEDQTDLTMVLDTFKYHFKNSIKLSGVSSNVSEQFLENLIEDKYSYIFRIRNRQTNGVLITSDFNKSYKKSYPDAKKLSLDRLAELLNDGLELKTKVEKSKMKPDNLKKRISGIFIDWEDFCNIFNIKTNKEEA